MNVIEFAAKTLGRQVPTKKKEAIAIMWLFYLDATSRGKPWDSKLPKSVWDKTMRRLT